MCRFSLNLNRIVKFAQLIEYKVYNEHVIFASLFRRRQRNKDKIKAFKMRKAGRMAKYFLRDGCSDWADSKFIPTGWKLNSIILNWFSLNPNCLVKICLAYIIQSVHWKYHISLFIQRGTKKQGQKQLLWERESLLFAFWLGRQWTLSWRINSQAALAGDI